MYLLIKEDIQVLYFLASPLPSPLPASFAVKVQVCDGGLTDQMLPAQLFELAATDPQQWEQ